MLRRLLIFIFVIFCLGTITFVLLNENSKIEFSNNEENDVSETNNIDVSETNNIDVVEQLNNTEQLENKTYYFAYGSNMDLDLLRTRIKNEKIVPENFAVLKNYKLIFPRGVGSVIFDENTEVYGCLYLLTKEEIARLDVIEGYREDREKAYNSYNREWIEVELSNGKKILSEIYIQTNNLDVNSLPSKSYKQTLVKGAKDCSFPEFYQEQLKQIVSK